MKKSNVYTRTGDCGQTSLVGGERVPKCCCRLEAYGTIDELNSHLGLLATYIEDKELLDRVIQCQSDLFTLGSQLATAPGSTRCPQQDISTEDIEQLEHAIDAAHEGLPPWRGFTLPGGCRGAAVAHVCRAVCRRAERQMFTLNNEEPIAQNLLIYINRLSDYLYVLACRLNFQSNTKETLWKQNSMGSKE